jgi:hypothetical protein
MGVVHRRAESARQGCGLLRAPPQHELGPRHAAAGKLMSVVNMASVIFRWLFSVNGGWASSGLQAPSTQLRASRQLAKLSTGQLLQSTGSNHSNGCCNSCMLTSADQYTCHRLLAVQRGLPSRSFSSSSSRRWSRRVWHTPEQRGRGAALLVPDRVHMTTQHMTAALLNTAAALQCRGRAHQGPAHIQVLHP